MKKKFLTKAAAISLVSAMAVSLAACGGSGSGSGNSGSSSVPEVAEDPSERETVVVTIARQTTTNPKFPDGDTYEDNAYIRMAEDRLNIDIQDAFEANGEDYTRQVSLALSAGDLPDIMKVDGKDELTELYENELIADLTGVYEAYASDGLKAIYDSYEGRALGNVTYDGQIMAIPATNVDNGPSMAWIRMDWAEQLGLTVDADGDHCITIEEVKNIAKTFKDSNPENVDNMVGLAFMPSLTGGDADTTMSINAIAYANGAYPRAWYEKDGEMVYGSTTEEMKTTLAMVKEWYDAGIVDPQLGTRTWDDVLALMTNGQLGVMFGTWHIPDWMLNNVFSMNNDAVFEPYAVINQDGDPVNCKHNNSTGGFIVVNKNFDHPEIAIQIANLFYDEMANSTALLEEYPEVDAYQTEGVDGTARPFNIEVKNSTYLLDDYRQLSAAVAGEATKDDINSIEEKANYDSIMFYNDGNTSDVTGWCKIHSRLKGVALMNELETTGRYNWLTPVYPETTRTMNTNWANLQTLEEETFIKIVTGAVDLESGFDQFVSDWKAQGGDTISQEIVEQLESR